MQQFKKIILATDDDQKGRVLRDELAVRLGRSRCWFVTYPKGCKVANEVLVAHGVGALQKMIAEAKPIVPSRLASFSEIPWREDARISYSVGYERFDHHFMFVPPQLIVVTGGHLSATPRDGPDKRTALSAGPQNFSRLSRGMNSSVGMAYTSFSSAHSSLRSSIPNQANGRHDHQVYIEPTTIRGARGQYYRVHYQGAVLIDETWNPELEACRALLARGIVGRLEVWRFMFGKDHPNMVVPDIAKAAQWTVVENEKSGPRFARWKPRPEHLPQNAVSLSAPFPPAGVRSYGKEE